MLAKVPEKSIRIVRWVLAISWLVLIFSLFYDPFSLALTRPEATWSVFRLDPRTLDPQLCHQVSEVQGKCLTVEPYPLGARIFWGMIIPMSIFLLLLFGHEFWRRICPLSFFSQLPRALGKQRQQKFINPSTGIIRYNLAKVSKNSWLANNHFYLQFCLLFLGLVIRIVLVDSNRFLLGIFLLSTIATAIFVGYWFGGKSWCQYFCPMAPVEVFYNGLRSLLGTEAHQNPERVLTQSMCRTIDEKGQEKSACVGCQSPCIDIDAERFYWQTMNKPGRKLVQYGYAGLVFGFFLYYYLYSGNFNYYYSGVWSHDENQLNTIFAPGFYINQTLIPIPKLIAVPLTLAICVWLSYWGFNKLEKLYIHYLRQNQPGIKQQQVLHHLFSICTFIVFNLYFLMGGNALFQTLFPASLAAVAEILIPVASSLWLYRTLGRSEDAYYRESLAGSLRHQLAQLSIDFSSFLDGRSLHDMKPDEIYVLAKVLPNFNKEYGLQVYRGLLRDALETGKVNSANSMEWLLQIRLALGINEEGHFKILSQLGIEDPQLLFGSGKQSLENKLRLANYRELSPNARTAIT